MSDSGRQSRMRLSLEGLALGDAFGERFFGPPQRVVPMIEQRALPGGLWRYTDDTVMALSICDELAEHGAIDQSSLARRFADRYDAEPNRGYGGGAHQLLSGLCGGLSWRELSTGLFGGQGSFGNGGAMRVAPLGAWFADDLDRCVEQARLSCEVTHSHPEGVAGAVAVAVAAALVWQRRQQHAPLGPHFLDAVIERVPLSGRTMVDTLRLAASLPANISVADAAQRLGNGSGVSAQDTVPLCLWLVAHTGSGPDQLEQALWRTVSALGDRDTTCAIVGGIVALRCGTEGIPETWRAARERLPCERWADPQTDTLPPPTSLD